MSRLALFAATGVELEYMLVDADSLSVLPIADEVLRSALGDYGTDVERGEIGWSNELVLHVLELKTARPAPRLAPLPGLFQQQVREVQRIAEARGGRLMPTGMHPWMDPVIETRLWPHQQSRVYQAFDRVFGCQGHGWANLQSTHVNLPFADDRELGRLHAAVRLVLPILPALAASSPVVEGRLTGRLDSRLTEYRGNAAKVPSVGGEVIPEPVFTEAGYRRVIFEPMMAEIGPLDPEGVLEEEFLNSRGAIARFSRGSIEIRLIDAQECPLADLSVVALTVAAIRLLVAGRWSSLASQQALEVAPLAQVLEECIVRGEEAEVTFAPYLRTLGLGAVPRRAGEIWRHLAEAADAFGCLEQGPWAPALELSFEKGPLARRILRALGDDPDRSALVGVYRRLCECLEAGELFR